MEAFIATGSFGEINFSRTDLGRLLMTANRILQHPGGTLPDKLNDPAELKGLYRLVDCDCVTHAAVLSQHRELVRHRIQTCSDVVLVLHDGTEFDYTSKTTLSSLGYIGKGHHYRGYICHNSLAVVAGTREVLGLMNQILHTRPAVPKGESRGALRARPNRESRLWRQGCEGCELLSTKARVVDVADRGADLYEFLEFEQLQDRHYVVRSNHDRQCEIKTSQGIQTTRLHAFARTLPTGGEYTVDVSPRDHRPGRTANVGIAARQVELLPPRNPRGQHGDQPLRAWVIYVREIDPPNEADSLEWILLTNVPTQNQIEARERVEWYAHRWIIEEFHKAQKTGCGIELPQFTTQERLEPMIALLSVVAVELLRLRNAARSSDTRDQPASMKVSKTHIEVLSAWRYKESRDMSVHEFYMALARLGGHQNRKHDHPPGWLILWRGWTKLETMTIGVTALRRARCG